MPRKRNYLNNRDILKQIHLSKITYCSFKDRIKDNQFDYIVEDVSEITPEVIELAREAKVKRTNRDNNETITLEDVDNTDVVIRVMTTEHIPYVPKKKNNDTVDDEFTKIIEDLDLSVADDYYDNDDVEDEIEMVPVKTNFHPFFHYRVDENNNPYIVGKSHWKGDLETGNFSQSHGKTTDELAKMYMKLCERYGTRSNWRGYTYNDEMQGAALMQLIQVGLKFNELKSDNPFAYYTAIVTNSFTRVLLNEKKMQNIRDDILEENGLAPSWTRQQQQSDALETERSAEMYKQKKERAIKHAHEKTE